MFNQLEKSTYPQLIAERVRRLITEQHLYSGDRLPSEREMAEQFGVSRSSIREGIKLLAAQGLVETRTGDGIYVTDDLTTSVLQPVSWAISLIDTDYSDFVETRMILEPTVAALAALRASEEDKRQMLETIHRLEASLGDQEKVVEADMDFHLVIAKSVGNQLLFETMVGIQRLLRPILSSTPLELEYQKLALQEHKDIFEGIQRGDAAAAREAMAKSIAKDQDLQQLMTAIGDIAI
ncbi:MAG: FadR/GntR family transcriptional regulator [Anaerolineales bacterium]